MNIAFYAVLLLHVLACFFLIGVVLLQQGKGQDLASTFGGGVTQTAFGPRGSANILSRATTILAALFMVTSLTLSMLRPQASSFLDQVPASAAPTAAPTSGAPAGSPAPADAAASPVAPADGAAPAQAPAESPRPQAQ